MSRGVGKTWGGNEALNQKLAALVETGDVQDSPVEIAYFDIVLGDDVTDCGSAIVHYEDEAGAWNLELTLGPRNMAKVIDFLRKLPPEPDEDGDGHRVGVSQMAIGNVNFHDWWAWVERPGEVDMDTVPKGMRIEVTEQRESFSRSLVGPFPDQDSAQLWLDDRNSITRMVVPSPKD